MVVLAVYHLEAQVGGLPWEDDLHLQDQVGLLILVVQEVLLDLRILEVLVLWNLELLGVLEVSNQKNLEVLEVHLHPEVLGVHCFLEVQELYFLVA